MQRRDFVELLGLAGLSAAIPNNWRVRFHPSFADDPFSLGVASGDPTATGVTLWTRLAPKPLEPDGGMAGVRTAVNWEVANDEAFATIVKRGRATAAPELGYSVHADVEGLEPGRWYFYRFTAGQASSPVGRTRTAPADGVTAPLRFAFASCQNYEEGYFTAYQHMAAEDLDLMMHLGDYIYEYSPAVNRVRRHANPEIISIGDYRMRYAQYKTDEHLRTMHARCPWLVTWDDHEVDNNYADLIGENGMESEEQMHARRAAAYQAWWENQPVRVPRARSWADLTIRRDFSWGALAKIWMLDTRQYRSDQSCGDGNKEVPCGDWNNPARTIMGTAQESWLSRGLRTDKARWQILGQQVMMAPMDFLAGPKAQVSMDQWSGYPVERDRLLGTIAKSAANRTVVLSGDIHSNWVNDLRANFSRPNSPFVAAEFVGTSITSGGDGADKSTSVTDVGMSENPHLKWQNSRRGYVRCDVTPGEWKTAYRTMPFITKPDAPVQTPSQWRVEWGRAGIQAG